MKRKYRKLWRAELASRARGIDRTPKRRRDRDHGLMSWYGRTLKRDAVEEWLVTLTNHGVGDRPDAIGRACRWTTVRYSEALTRELKKAALELGLYRSGEDFRREARRVKGH